LSRSCSSPPEIKHSNYIYYFQFYIYAILLYISENGKLNKKWGFYADVNARNQDGSTALMLAARNSSNPEVITALIKGGADAKLKDISGRMAIDIAKGNKNLENTNAFWELNDRSF